MLQIELLEPTDIERAAKFFHRDGFVAVKNALTPKQLQVAQAGTNRVIAEQVAETGLENANRGFARFSFGDQTRHPEWTMLIDLPTTMPISDRIWGNGEYSCSGAGGDYSVPGAQIQKLHSDMSDFLRDPIGQTTFHDLPAPFIVINFLMVDFTKENDAIRFVPRTQRSRAEIPSLEEEPEWMKNSIVRAFAGTAIIRDVRWRHGGTENTSQQIRPMTSAGYFAPWFQKPAECVMPRDIYDTLSPRAQQLCRALRADD